MDSLEKFTTIPYLVIFTFVFLISLKIKYYRSIDKYNNMLFDLVLIKYTKLNRKIKICNIICHCGDELNQVEAFVKTKMILMTNKITYVI